MNQNLFSMQLHFVQLFVDFFILFVVFEQLWHKWSVCQSEQLTTLQYTVKHS